MTIKKAVFVRGRKVPAPHVKPVPAYIIVYQYRPKGCDWRHNRFLIHPAVFGSMSEAQACFALCGFDHLFRCRPELRDGQRWKISAAYENARVWIKQERRRRKEFADT